MNKQTFNAPISSSCICVSHTAKCNCNPCTCENCTCGTSCKCDPCMCENCNC